MQAAPALMVSLIICAFPPPFFILDLMGAKTERENKSATDEPARILFHLTDWQYGITK